MHSIRARRPGRRYLLATLFVVAVVGGLAVGVPKGGAEVSSITEQAEAAAPGSAGVDDVTLAQALVDAGIALPAGSGVYAVRVDGTSAGLAYAAYEAGEGSLYVDFWPASSIKVLAAVGALEYLADLGFTGAARITMGGQTFTVADVYEVAIVDSSNEAYDQLVRIAGVDWLNTRFLTPDNGFPASVIQRSYTGDGVDVSPAMTIVEGSLRTTVPARAATATYGCGDDGNCSNLLEMTESVRRVILDAEIPETERFGIAPADIAGLTEALLRTEGFVDAAAEEVLGHGALVYNKPGYVPGDACVDVALITDGSGSERYLLAVETPEDGGLCPTVADVAAATLKSLVGTAPTGSA